MEAFLGGMALLLDPKILLVVFAGTLLGIVVGALPGISGSTTTALLLPFTITMTPVEAIAFLGALYCAANFGGSITAILVNSPGDPSASATAFDGYPMAQKGQAGRALGMSAVASAIGGIFSVIVLLVAAPLFAVSEMLERATQLHIVPQRLALDAVRLPSRDDFRKCAKAISMSSVLGTV